MSEWPNDAFRPPAPEEGLPEEAETPAPEREAEARADEGDAEHEAG